LKPGIVSSKIETEILIHASPETVWAVLMDFAAYPSWNPFILSIEGKAEAGETLRVTLRPPGDKARTVKPKVLRAQRPEAFVWRGSLPIPGLFTGEHSFQLTRAGDDTRLRHAESFSGVLVPFLRTLLARSEEGFNQMNAALKARAQARK
jgi:hypothetical protein